MTNFAVVSTNDDINDNFNIIANKLVTFPLVDIEAVNQSLDISKIIDSIFFKLKFKQETKGTYYLKCAIFLAYYDQTLLYDHKRLLEIVSLEYLSTTKNVRSLLDNSIYNILKKSSSRDVLFNLFPNDYDGENITVKNFILICVNHLNDVTGKQPINMYQFI